MGIKYAKLYNDEECWNLYMSWGAAASIKKLVNWHLANKGFGSQMGVFWAMWRWACANPEICYPQYGQWWFYTATSEGMDSGITYSEFLEICRKHASKRNVMGLRNYKAFCEKHGLRA